MIADVMERVREVLAEIRRQGEHEALATRARDYVSTLTEGADVDDLIDGPQVAPLGRHFGGALMLRGWCLWRTSARERVVLDAYQVHALYPATERAWATCRLMGIQEGPGGPLELRECPTCGTTMAKKTGEQS